MAVKDLGERLERFWRYYGPATRTQTRDTSAYGVAYISGLLRMEAKRTIANIGRKQGLGEQNMQHFISQSPWESRKVLELLHAEVAQRGELAGGMLILDESGESKQGQVTAGVAPQYNGRHQQVENCQMGVYLAYGKGAIWTWLDGELYLPKRWFQKTASQRRQQVGIPDHRHYQKKAELGWELIQRAQAAGIPFAAVGFDSGYGLDSWLRDQCQAHQIVYYAAVPAKSLVYLRDPQAAFVPKSNGRIPKNPQILSRWGWQVRDLVDHPNILWQTLDVRPTARGVLTADFAVHSVWTIRPNGDIVPERLLMRRDLERVTYTLTNAPATVSLPQLAYQQSQRFFVERSIQDAKSEFGFDEFQAVKYRAWEHHLALTILASWFVTETRLDWLRDQPPDPDLTDGYTLDDLPALSVANVRELLRAALPLPQLSPEQAARLVLQHLDNRTRSRSSRLKLRSGP